MHPHADRSQRMPIGHDWYESDRGCMGSDLIGRSIEVCVLGSIGGGGGVDTFTPPPSPLIPSA